MRSLIVFVCVVIAASVAENYDGRDGPHVFGEPGNGVYIRGQNEGPYQVPGVGGTFQNSPSGVHHYTDEHGNVYTHHSSSARSSSVAPSLEKLAMGCALFLFTLNLIPL